VSSNLTASAKYLVNTPLMWRFVFIPIIQPFNQRTAFVEPFKITF
jgi:hypothetical protein